MIVLHQYRLGVMRNVHVSDLAKWNDIPNVTCHLPQTFQLAEFAFEYCFASGAIMQPTTFVKSQPEFCLLFRVAIEGPQGMHACVVLHIPVHRRAWWMSNHVRRKVTLGPLIPSSLHLQGCSYLRRSARIHEQLAGTILKPFFGLFMIG